VIASHLSITQAYSGLPLCEHLAMDYSNETVDALLAFHSAPELEAGRFFDQAFSNTELEGFDFNESLGVGPEAEAQSSWLCSEDPMTFNNQQQLSYNEIIHEYFTAEPTLNSGIYTNIASKQGSVSTSPLVQSRISLDGLVSSSQPRVQPLAGAIDPASLSLPSLPSVNCGLDLDQSIPEFEDFYPHEQEAQVLQSWIIQQKLEQQRLEKDKLEQVRVEQLKAERARVEQVSAEQERLIQARPDHLIFEELLQEAENPVAEQALRQAIHQLPIMPAVLSKEFEQEMNPANQTGSDKVSKHPRDAKNSRPTNIARFIPEEHYIPLLEPPQTWGAMSPETGQPTFEYTSTGELIPTLRFTERQIQEYLTNHSLNDGRLTLWVQVCPADSSNRYPDKTHSSRCRFKACPIINNKIAIGEYRVTFDEQSWMSLPIDPYHNAGYVHLYCLEKYLDFPHLCKHFNVKPDIRAFADEKNKMAITRDYPDMERVVNDFILNSQSWNRARDNATYYRQTLCYALTMEHLKREPKKRQSIRDERNGNSIDKHLNNLDIKAENITRKREGLPLKVLQRPAFESPAVERFQTKKRKSRDYDDKANPSGSPAKKIKVMKKETAIKLRSSLKIPQRPQDMKRMSTDNEIVACAGSSVLPAKRPKIEKSFYRNDPKYGADESSSSSSSTRSPIESPKAPKQKYPAIVEQVNRPAEPVQRTRAPKRKARELEEGERDPNEVFQELVYKSMQTYGMNKRHKKW
jgi:hypothetical protein